MRSGREEPQQRDLGFQLGARSEGRGQYMDKQLQEVEHRALPYPIPSADPARMEFSARTGVLLESEMGADAIVQPDSRTPTGRSSVRFYIAGILGLAFE